MTNIAHQLKELDEDLKFIVKLKCDISNFQMFVEMYGPIKGVGEEELESIIETEKTLESYYYDIKNRQRNLLSSMPVHKPDQSDSPPPR